MLNFFITEVHLFNLSRNALKEWSRISVKTIPIDGDTYILATFLWSSAAIMKISIPAALDAALKAGNNSAAETIMDFLSSTK